MGKKEEIDAQVKEGEERKRKAQVYYQELLHKIEESSPLPVGAELARLVGSSAQVLLSRFSKRDTSIMQADLLLSLFLYCGAEVFFPGDRVPVPLQRTEEEKEKESLKKEIEYLKKIISLQEKNIMNLEDIIKGKNLV